VLSTDFNSSRRVYTKGQLAARLLGMTRGITDTATEFTRYTFRLEGLNGVEKSFNRDLLGDYGWRKVMLDARSRLVHNPFSENKPVSNGSSIYLTIDADVQEILESNLYRGLSQYGAKNGIGVILNPKNGNIIAMAGVNENDKSYNDNQLRSLQNMPIQFLFAPGSTVKPLVSLLALDKNYYKEDDMFDCRPMHLSYGRIIRDTHELGRINLRDVIAQSSNVGVAKIAERIGRDDMYRHYLNFGFGTTTTVDLLDESSGLFSKLSDWSQLTLHSISFGYEMSVTALQLANAYVALANGGYLLKPNIVDKKVDENGKEYFSSSRRVLKQVGSRKAIELNNSFLLDAVERGTGTGTKFQNIKVAGKTGTAIKENISKAQRTQYTASFAGFFPYENPQYVMVIVYDEPSYRYRFGSTSAVPTFKRVVEEMLTLPQCNIIPDLKMSNQELITMPRLTGMKTQDARKALDNLKIDYQIYNETPNSFIVQQYPQAGVQFGS